MPRTRGSTPWSRRSWRRAPSRPPRTTTSRTRRSTPAGTPVTSCATDVSGTGTTPCAGEVAAEVRAYREARRGRLTSPTGWLSLIAKAWLPEGTSRIGAAPNSEIWLDTPNAPALEGTVTRRGAAVAFTAAPGVEAVARGARVDALVLRSDAAPAPDEVAVGSLRLELIRRGDELALRVREP